MTPVLLPIALGCVTLDTGTTADAILWSGTVLDDPYLGEDPAGLEGGALVAVDLDDLEIAAGTEAEDSPGSFSIEVPPGLELALRVTGPSHAPTVFRGRSPAARGLWFNGALFGRQATPLQSFLDGIERADGTTPAALSEGELVHLWVEPTEPDALVGAELSLIDGSGLSGELVALTTADDGVLTVAGPDDPVTLILGLDLAPGDITLGITAEDGRTAETTWPARGGDLLASPLFALSAE